LDDIEAEGFVRKSFGDDVTQEKWEKKTTAIIATAALETKEAAGPSLYSSASGTVTFERIRRAELCHAAQALFAVLETIALRGRAVEEQAGESSPLSTARKRYRAEFDEIMILLGRPPRFSESASGPPSVSVSTSSHFAEDQPS